MASLSGLSRFSGVTASPAKRGSPCSRPFDGAQESRPDVRQAREAWFKGQLDLDPDRVVFLDETATATNVERRYGRAPRGERCRIAVPHGYDKTTTVTATLRAGGPFAIELMDGAVGRSSRSELLLSGGTSGSIRTVNRSPRTFP